MLFKKKKIKKLNQFLSQSMEAKDFSPTKADCKDEEILSLLDAGEKISSSAYSTKEPVSDNFQRQLLEKLLQARKEKNMINDNKTKISVFKFNFAAIMKNPVFLPSVLAGFVLLILGAVIIWALNLGVLPGLSPIQPVSAGQGYVSVNLPLAIEFPYPKASLEDIKANFSIEPQIDGDLSFDGKILVFDHEINFAYDTFYKITINQGLNIGEEKYLAEDFNLSFGTRPRARKQELFLSDYSQFNIYTLNYHDHNQPVFLRDYGDHSSYNFEVYKSSSEKLLQAFYKKNNWDRSADEDDDIVKYAIGDRLFERKVFINKGSGTFWAGINDTGIYLVNVSSLDNENYKMSFFLVVTKNVATTKRLGDKLVTWVVNQKGSASVPGVDVIAYGPSLEEKIFSKKTDQSGLSEYVVKGEDAVKPYILQISKGDDICFNIMNFEWQRDIYEKDKHSDVSNQTAYIYTDRPIYKPGDEVNYKLILRQKDANELYKIASKKVAIKLQEQSFGSESIVVYEKNITTSRLGTYDDVIKLNQELKSGDYYLMAVVGDQVLSQTRVSVEYYKKPEFEIKVSADKDKYIKGEKIKIGVASQYFFGQPNRNGDIYLSVYSMDQRILFAHNAKLDDNAQFSWELESSSLDLDFNNWWLGEFNNAVPVTVSAQITDTNGSVSTKTKTFYVYESQYNIADITSQEYRQLNENKPYEFTYQVKENLTGKLKQGLKLKMEIKRTFWDYNSRSHSEQIIKEFEAASDVLGEINFETEFPKSGRYQIEAKFKDDLGNEVRQIYYYWVQSQIAGILGDNAADFADKIVVSFDKSEYSVGDTATVILTLPRNQADLWWSINKNTFRKINIEKINDYKKEIKFTVTEDLVSGFYFHASLYQDEMFIETNELVPVSGKRLKVEILANKDKMYPGQEVELTIKTVNDKNKPIAAESSLSVIDKAIYSLKSDQTADIYEAFYPEQKNLLLTLDSMLILSSYGGAEHGGCFAPGTKILLADGSYKKIENIKVGDKILTKSNIYSDQLIIDEVTNTMEHLVNEYWLINNSLQITPVHKVLLNGKWQEISQAKIGDFLINKDNQPVKIESIYPVHSAIRVYNFTTKDTHTYIAENIYVHNDKGDSYARANFVDTAYWNGAISTNSQGEATVKFKMPDNLTTWVAMSRAISEDSQVGQATKEIVTYKNLIIRPNLPQFFRENDKIEVTAGINNYLGHDANLKVKLTVEGARISNQAEQTIKLGNNKDANANWALEIIGRKAVKLTFTVNEIDGKAVDTVILNVPVYSDLSLYRDSFSLAGSGRLDFAFEPQSSRANNSAQIIITSSVAAILPEVIEKLTGYPYGCVEQTMSKHLPNILAYKEKNSLSLALADDWRQSLDDGFTRLAKSQHESGGFGWWESDADNIWMSGYVMEGLIEAKKSGLLSSYEFVYDNLHDFLADRLKNNISDEEKIYIMYVLSKAGDNYYQLVDTYANQLLNGAGYDIQSQGYIALALDLNDNSKKARQVLEKIMSQIDNDHWNLQGGSDYHGALKDKYSATGVNLLALMEIGNDEDNVARIVQWLMNNRNGYEGLWGSTRQSSQILLALIKYLKTSNEMSPNYTYNLYVNGQLYSTDIVSDSKYKEVINLPQEKLSDSNYLEIQQQGEGKIFVKVIVNNYLSYAGISQKQGQVEFSRQYLSLDGKPKTEFKVGDVVRVKLTVKNVANQKYAFVEDYLPAGLEPVNERLDNAISRSDKLRGYFGHWDWDYNNVDYRQQTVNFFVSDFWSDEYVFEYLARASYKGDFIAPAPRFELMYSPEIFGFAPAVNIFIK